MKTSITQLVATALFAVLATTTTQAAASRAANHGRAGYAIVPITETTNTMKKAHPETRVALIMEKPEQTISKMQTAGRAGYAVVPNPSR